MLTTSFQRVGVFYTTVESDSEKTPKVSKLEAEFEKMNRKHTFKNLFEAIDWCNNLIGNLEELKEFYRSEVERAEQ